MINNLMSYLRPQTPDPYYENPRHQLVAEGTESLYRAPCGPEHAIKITSPFGWRLDPFGSGRRVFHSGVDLRTYWPGHPSDGLVYTIEGGRVVAIRFPDLMNPSENPFVDIVTPSGRVWRSVHLMPSVEIRIGSLLSPGFVIGRVDDLYGATTSLHLHQMLFPSLRLSQQGRGMIDPVPTLLQLGLKSYSEEAAREYLRARSWT